MIQVLLCVYITAFFMLYRNHQVHTYRRDLINGIYAKNMRAIHNGTYDLTKNIYEIFESVSYNEMVFKVWVRVDSFYTEEQIKEMIG